MFVGIYKGCEFHMYFYMQRKIKEKKKLIIIKYYG